MTVLFRSDSGPLEEFEEASFRVAVNDDGVGQVIAPPDVIAGISGPIVCSVDGVDVFEWLPEDRTRQIRDREVVTLSGRGLTSSLERAIVLPSGYPSYTERTRTEIGPPMAIWRSLLQEAQARGRVTSIAPSWTATDDSKGDPWTETVKAQLDPGVDLRQLLTEMSQVEGVEWLPTGGGGIDAAPTVGVDRSSEIVLFIGLDQLELNRTTSSRNKRQTVYLEASTGVSEVTNGSDVEAGEIWLEGQDFADPTTRPIVANKLADQLEQGEEEVTVSVRPDVGVFSRFAVGDIISVDTGESASQVARVVGIAMKVGSGGVEVELTLFSEVQLRQQKVDQAIQAKADVKLAASTTLQRRHGLVTADKFLSGAVGDSVAISSENYVAGVDGWAILGNGNAEFNDAVFRGDLQSDNYVAGVSGWALDRDGDAELNDATIRGDLQSDNFVSGSAGWALDRNGDAEFYDAVFRGDLQSDNYVAGTSGWQLLATGAAEFDEGTFRGDILGGTISIGTDAFNVDASGNVWAGNAAFASAPFKVSSSGVLDVSGATITGGTIRTAATGRRVELSSDRLRVYSTDNSLTGSLSNVAVASRIDLTAASGKRLLVSANGGVMDINTSGDIAISCSGGSPWQIGSNGVARFASVDATGTVAADYIFGEDGAEFQDAVTFETTSSGRRFFMTNTFVGGSGNEPTLDCSSSNFGAVGLPSRPIWRGYANSWVSTSVRSNKGEVAVSDTAQAYEQVKNLVVYEYSLSRSRDEYYGAKGEWMLGEREEFEDPGGPLRRIGLMADEAPETITDGEGTGIDSYAVASLAIAAVKEIQSRMEALEAQYAG